MSHHIGDTNEMSDTPRTDAEYERLFEIYRNWERKNEPLCCSFENDMRLCRQLERELNAANGRIELLMSANADVARIAGERDAAEKRIKRLEAELEQTKQDRNAIAKNIREPLLLQLDHANERIKRLEEAGDEMAQGCVNSSRLAYHWCKAKEAKL